MKLITAKDIKDLCAVNPDALQIAHKIYKDYLDAGLPGTQTQKQQTLKEATNDKVDSKGWTDLILKHLGIDKSNLSIPEAFKTVVVEAFYLDQDTLGIPRREPTDDEIKKESAAIQVIVAVIAFFEGSTV